MQGSVPYRNGLGNTGVNGGADQGVAYGDAGLWWVGVGVRWSCHYATTSPVLREDFT